MVDPVAKKDLCLSYMSSSSGPGFAKKPLFLFEKDSFISMKETLEENSGYDFIKTLFHFVWKPFAIVWKTICSLVSPSMLRSNNLVDFYRGTTANTDGVSLNEIWEWTDEQLEDIHTYIQWLFPSTRSSDYNPDAPVLNRKTIEAFHKDPILKKNLLHSFNRMLTFYGLQWNEANETIIRASNCTSREFIWLTAENHNFLRMTRILVCLSSLGLKAQAKALLAILIDISQKEGKSIISSKNLSYWEKAAHFSC